MSHRFAPGSLSSASPHETEKIVRLARYFESKPMRGSLFRVSRAAEGVISNSTGPVAVAAALAQR